MTKIIVSTIHREILNSKVSGWLFVVDLETHKIIRKTSGVEPPYRVRDINPRGGMRGMRGISILNGELAVANYSSVLIFDREWNLLRVFTHPAVSAIHGITYTGDGVWVTSTANDMLAKFDMSGALSRYYLMRSQHELMRRLNGPANEVFSSADLVSGKLDFRVRSYFNSDIYDRTHLNSIASMSDGSLLLSLGLVIGNYFTFLMAIKTLMLKLGIWNFFLKVNRFFRSSLGLKKHLHSELITQPVKGCSAIVKFDLEHHWDLILQLPSGHNPGHSVSVLKDGTGVYLNTSSGELVHFGQENSVLLKRKVTERFLRGVLELPDRRLVIGAGNTLLVFDMNTLEVVDEIELSEEPMHTVFDIQLLPPDFELPPASLEAKTGRMVCFDGGTVIWEHDENVHSSSHS